jgi:hypothetical protein
LEWVLLKAHDYYLRCANNRKYHDINAEFGYGYNYYLDYEQYAYERWVNRGEG